MKKYFMRLAGCNKINKYDMFTCNNYFLLLENTFEI